VNNLVVEKTDGHCVGAVRLASIDSGFEMRGRKIRIDWPADEILSRRGQSDQTGVGYDATDGRRQMWGSRKQILAELRRCAYIV